MTDQDQGGKPDSFSVHIEDCNPQPFATLAEAQRAAIDASYVHRQDVSVNEGATVIFMYQGGHTIYSKIANDSVLAASEERALQPPEMASFIRGECENTPEFLTALRHAADRAREAGHADDFVAFILETIGG